MKKIYLASPHMSDEKYEEKYVKRCIDSIKESASHFKGNVETIIVCNCCTDKTAEIAKDNGAVVVANEDRCIAWIGWMIKIK